MKLTKIGLLAIGMFSTLACKEVTTTNAPGSGPGGAVNGGDAKAASAQVTGTTDVSLEQIPQLTVAIDLTACIGTGRWYDPDGGTGSKLGALSVTPTRTAKVDSAQPTPWVFDPALNKVDETVAAKATNKWRIDRGDYTVEAIAYDVMSPTDKFSSITKSFDFKTTNDLKIEAVGSWVNSKCSLAWK